MDRDYKDYIESRYIDGYNRSEPLSPEDYGLMKDIHAAVVRLREDIERIQDSDISEAFIYHLENFTECITELIQNPDCVRGSLLVDVYDP